MAGTAVDRSLEANVRQDKKLKAGLAAAMAIATLAGTSAFADSRPQRGTRDSGGAIRRDAGASRAEGRRGNTSVTRSESRGSSRRSDGAIRRDGASTRGSESRGDITVRAPRDTRRGESGSGRTYEADRNRRQTNRQGRAESFRRGTDSRSRTDSRYRSGGYRTEPYHTRGRIERYQRYRDGYRVWVGGAPYPFYVPSRYWHRDRFRVGLWISLGGYYNPLGYYDYYDGYRDGYYDSRYNDRRAYSRGEIRGIVESVDARRTSFVLRNDDTGDYITVLPRARRVYVRPGDYVEVDGTWSRSGYFTAYDIDWLDGDRRYDDY
jgi:hypothetical protein